MALPKGITNAVPISGDAEITGVKTFTQTIAGTAAAAEKLATARTITLSGAASGSISFDGSADATLEVSIGGNQGAVIGEVRWFAMSTPPEGWLVCNGAAVGRATYPELFAAIGTIYGTGDGSTTFNLPNLVDKFVEGSATAGTVKSAGLPNIKGFISFRTVADTDNNLILGGNDILPPTGPFYKTTKSWSGAHSALNESVYSPYAIEQLNMDASRSSSIYGNSTTVQPPALCLLPCIRYE